jgi:HEPN domain-containing protein
MEIFRMGDTEQEADAWRIIAACIRDALPHIDAMLSERDISLAKRRSKAIDFVRHQMIETNADTGTLIVTEAYAQIVALIDDWYAERYDTADKAGNDTFASLIFIFDTPFAFDVPLTFTTLGEEKGSAWFGWPACVQPEESPLDWIIDGPKVSGLTDAAHAELADLATTRANSIRATNFDLRTVMYGPCHEHAELARMIVADLKSAAIALRSGDPGLCSSSGWAMSQATEKALKLYIRVKGGTPKNIHILPELADHADSLETYRVNRSALDEIPSGSHAVGLRYGGAFSWKQGEAAYAATLDVIEKLATEVEIKTEYNVRNARFLLKPPWFGFDTDAFINSIKAKTQATPRGA